MEIPTIRNDLELYPWEPEQDGTEQWVINDPLRSQFFVVSREVLEIFKRMHLKNSTNIALQVNAQTKCRVGLDDVARVVDFATQNNLIVPTSVGDISRVSRQPNRTTWWMQFIHKYIMFRVHLLRPDKFLTTSQKFVSPLFTRAFFVLTVLVGVLGIFLTVRDWNSFQRNLEHLWSVSGLVNIFTTLVFVKLVHEFAHAYTAKRYGVRVPVMGITFIVLFPLPFTNTTDSWKLYSHRQRFNIASAGIISELVLACWATLLWKIFPEGALQSTLFLVATTTWISSLLVNASPFMRFDGYFLLMDYLRIPNLHARSGALARWWLRELVFDLNELPPEKFKKNIHNFLIAFAYLTWIYRFFVFLAIALIVYHFFIKAVGVFMFVVEIYYFILRPIFSEIRMWAKAKQKIMKRKRYLITLAFLIVFVGFFVVPFQRSVSVPAVFIPFEEVSIYAPLDARVLSVEGGVGDQIKAGDIMAVLGSEYVRYERDIAAIQANAVAHSVQSALLDASGQGASGRQQSWVAAMSRLREAEQRVDLLEVHAPLSGSLINLSQDFVEGSSLRSDTYIGTIRGERKNELHAYIDERVRRDLAVGDEVTFFFIGQPANSHTAKIINISETSDRRGVYPELLSAYGGPLPSFRVNDTVELVQPAFKVQLFVLEDVQARPRAPAFVNLRGEQSSLALNVGRRAVNILLREFGG